MVKMFTAYAPIGRTELLIEIPNLIRMDGYIRDYFPDIFGRNRNTPLAYSIFGVGDYSKPFQYIHLETQYSLYNIDCKDDSFNPMLYNPLGSAYKSIVGSSFLYYRVFDSIDEAYAEIKSEYPIHLVPLERQ